jgi:hypothetical protein
MFGFVVLRDERSNVQDAMAYNDDYFDDHTSHKLKIMFSKAPKKNDRLGEHIYTYTHTHTYTYSHTYTHTHTHTHRPRGWRPGPFSFPSSAS